MTAPLSLEECRRKLQQIAELRRIVSFGPDKARLTAQYEELERECAQLEAAQRG